MAITRVEKQLYPEFGEKCAASDLNWKKIAKIVAIFALVIIASAAVGFLVGNVPGALLGAGIASISLSTLTTTKAVIEKIREKRFLCELPKDENSPSSLGKYTRANMRLAATSKEGLEWKMEMISSAAESLELSANFAGGAAFESFLSCSIRKWKKIPDSERTCS